MKKKINKIIISGGGTGGHIFPAIAIANEVKNRFPNCEILFIGAIGKMEMTRVPKAGYNIIGLDIQGIQRKFTLKNALVPFKLIKSLYQAKKIIKNFKPNAVIGVGGYASAPTLLKANYLNLPTLLQEQNSFPGLTNKLLSKRVRKICVAYDGLERFFLKDKIVKTGNPVRENVVNLLGKKEQAISYFNLDANKKTILIIGGSLGALTLNNAIKKNIDKINKNDFQVIWQCGKYYEKNCTQFLDKNPSKKLKLHAFIDKMDFAYSCADIVVSRSGALSISELCITEKATILVPSPNVSDDHQTKNAMALVKNNAAILVKDSDAEMQLIDKVIEVLNDKNQLKNLSHQISKMKEEHSTQRIVDEILNII